MLEWKGRVEDKQWDTYMGYLNESGSWGKEELLESSTSIWQTCRDWLRSRDQSQVQPACGKRQQLQRAASNIQYICPYPHGSLIFQMANRYERLWLFSEISLKKGRQHKLNRLSACLKQELAWCHPDYAKKPQDSVARFPVKKQTTCICCPSLRPKFPLPPNPLLNTGCYYQNQNISE